MSRFGTIAITVGAALLGCDDGGDDGQAGVTDDAGANVSGGGADAALPPPDAAPPPPDAAPPPPDAALRADCSDPLPLTDDRVNGDRTLPAHTCYLVESRVFVSDGKLTIEEGVVVQFAGGAHMVVRQDGRIDARGSAASPVRFTGTEELRWHWRGISVETTSVDNVFDHVVLEYGGGDRWTGSNDSQGMLWVPGKLRITNTTFREAANYALRAFVDSNLEGFADNRFVSNAVPIRVDANRPGQFAGTSEFVDNDEQAIYTTGALTVESTWKNLGVPYRVRSRMFVDAAWTVEPGVVVEVEEGQPIKVRAPDGKLTAMGEPDAPIVFTGVEPVRGYWHGLAIESNSVGNVLDHVTIQHAGGHRWTGAGDSQGALWITGRATITNSTFRENEDFALRASGGSSLEGFAANTFENNDVPMRVASDRLGEMAGTSRFIDNEEQAIQISGNVTADATWQNVGVPYRVISRVFVHGGLVLEPGVTVTFDQGVPLIVQPDGGTLTVRGPPDDKVTFTGGGGSRSPVTGWA